MTYNQLIKDLTQKAESHAQINTVVYGRPDEWLEQNKDVQYPAMFFYCNGGTIANKMIVHNLDFFFLDISTLDKKNELEVQSDMMSVCKDFVSLVMKPDNDSYQIQGSIRFDIVSDSKEDNLAGVLLSMPIGMFFENDRCAIPLNS